MTPGVLSGWLRSSAIHSAVGRTVSVEAIGPLVLSSVSAAMKKSLAGSSTALHADWDPRLSSVDECARTVP